MVFWTAALNLCPTTRAAKLQKSGGRAAWGRLPGALNDSQDGKYQ